MKKFITLLSLLSLIAITLTACGSDDSDADTTSGSIKAYSTKVSSIKESKNYGNPWEISGSTNAPNGAKIFVANSNKDDSTSYAENAATNNSDSWAEVKDGKFKAIVNPVDLVYDEKEGQNVNAKVVAIENYDSPVDASSDEIPKNMKNIIDNDKYQNEVFSVTKNQYKYYQKISNPSHDDDSSSDDNTPKKHTNVDVNSFNTGITYDQLSRTPDQYKNKKVTFTGEVAQAINQDGVTEIRLAVNGNYDNIILVDVSNDDLNGSRILENDLVTFYGTSDGIAKYKSTSGAPIEIPSALAEKVTDSGKASDDYGE